MDDKVQTKDPSVIIALVVTVIAAIILVPVWLWNTKQQQKQLSGQNVEGSGIDIDTEQLNTLTKPGEEFDKQLQSILASPVQVNEVETAEEELLVFFTVVNETLTHLTFPTSKAFIYKNGNEGEKIEAIKMTTFDNKQFVPEIRAGDERQGVLHFEKIVPGHYILVFPDMKYKGENQSLFSQEISIEIDDVWLPRT